MDEAGVGVLTDSSSDSLSFGNRFLLLGGRGERKSSLVPVAAGCETSLISDVEEDGEVGMENSTCREGGGCGGFPAKRGGELRPDERLLLPDRERERDFCRRFARGLFVGRSPSLSSVSGF